ncbi:MAG: hypothetical protein IT236_18955 [Bacteroidia bacterium]|nr:hypothetical protein [Bacteroidia bacterium]
MNGQEKDEEIFTGAMNAEYWEYDSRILRRWNVDPVIFPWQSPYVCFDGNPIVYSDVLGASTSTETPKPSDGGKIPTPDSGKQGVVITAETQRGFEFLGIPPTMPPILVLPKTNEFVEKQAFIAGYLNATGSNYVFGIGYKDPSTYSSSENQNRSFAKGQIAGNNSSIAMGFAEALHGGGKVMASAEAGPPGLIIAVEGTAELLHGQSQIRAATVSNAKAKIYLSHTGSHNGNGGAEDSQAGGLDDGKVPEVNPDESTIPFDKVEVQFGSNENQTNHAFRHIEAIGLDREIVKSKVLEHFKTVYNQLTIGTGKHFFIEVGGEVIKYRAFRLSNSKFNIGKIHEVR